MSYELNQQPQFDGATSFCNKSFHLVNKNPNSLNNLQKTLKKTGGFGKRKSQRKLPMKKKSRKLQRKLPRKKKSRKSQRKSPKFGSPPFLKGKLSTSTGNLGLPHGESSPVTIYQTYPNIYRQGQALPRPYDMVDNLRMQSLFEIRGFGKNKNSKVKKRKSKNSKNHICTCEYCIENKKTRKLLKSRKSNRKNVKSFGQTPGTNEWKQEAIDRNNLSKHLNKYANEGKLSPAKGYTPNEINLYDGTKSSNIPNLIGMPNSPAQFSNNQLNSPILSFGKHKRKSLPKESLKYKIKSLPKESLNHKRKSLSEIIKEKTGNHKRKSLSEIIKNKKHTKRNFGEYGPNVVGYEAPIPIYHGGGNTINFQTNELYRPDIVPDIGKVQTDGMTKKAWLTQSSGIGDGLGNTFRFGKKFGTDLVYNPNGFSGTGINTIEQPLPDYMKNTPEKKKLSTSFGGSVITLQQDGKITIKSN